ncbi:hypothetical protein Pmani_025321 [Petrolisthes manimaculis]|uniref:Leucine-rich repeat-containing protein 59 n=1 Tax=Petrolisthes manimaculis TaxID=1843537 RepID=A0AAE1TXR5_9EUCA|nr:hypothetical protein Pmani_025321 [Petrolisthes manimaculis]
MAKNSLRDKLEGDELDLGMLRWTEVPVKEIAALPRATKIDLSSNELTSLPSNFAQSLGHVTRLELGSNKIKELPQNFYKLQNLRHLDLYNNQLTDLPLTFCQLPSLKWLDLKGNPLNETLKKVAGDCLNRKECEAAARNVIAHLKNLQAQIEMEKEEKMKQEREKEAALTKEEDAKLAKKRAERKAAKEKKKAEERAAQEAQKAQLNGSANTDKHYNAIPKPAAPPTKKSKVSQSRGTGGGWSLLAKVNMMLFVLLLTALGTGLYVYTDGDLTPAGITKALPHIAENSGLIAEYVVEVFQPENLKQTAQTVGTTVSETSSHLWSSLQEYTGDLSIYTEPVVDILTEGWLWLRKHALYVYDWITKNVDWDSVVEAIRSAAFFMYEQFLVACEELSKNQALMSVLSAIRTQTAVVMDYLAVLAGIAWEYISHVILYIQEEGPGILEAAREQAAGALHTVKQSVQDLVK